MSNIGNGGGNHGGFVRGMFGHTIVVETAHSSNHQANEREQHLLLALGELVRRRWTLVTAFLVLLSDLEDDQNPSRQLPIDIGSDALFRLPNRREH